MIAIRLIKEGRVIREQFFEELPVTIGRSAKGGFTISDESVSQSHAVIEADGDRFILRDLESRNGLWHQERRVKEVTFDRMIRCHVGLVELEIVSPFKGATREVPVAEWNQQNRRRTLRHFVAYILIGASAVILEEFLKMSTWANKPDENWVGLGEEALMALMGVPIAGLILLIVLKSIGRKVRLADTLLAMAVVMWLAPLLRVLGWVTHYVASGSVGDVIQLLATAGGTVFVLVYLASLRRDPKSRAFQYTVAAVAILIFIGSKGLKKYSSNDDNSQNTDFYLRPPIMEFVGPTHSLEEFMRESRERSKEVFSTLKE